MVEYPLTEIGLAERLVHRYGEDLRFSHQNGRWSVWSGIVGRKTNG